MDLLSANLDILLLGLITYGWFRLAYYLFSLPMRRRERVRLFLDLLEAGLRQGRSPEETVLGLATSGDRTLGRHFIRFARRVRGGMTFRVAVQADHRFFPTEIARMLSAGGEADRLLSVLPACHARLGEGTTEVWKAYHYLVVLAVVVTPAWQVVFTLFVVFVLPRLNELSAAMGAGELPLLTFLARHAMSLMLVQAVLVVLFWFLALLYLGGPRLRRWFMARLRLPLERWIFLLPWRRRRMQCDFSAMLALLLDAGLPENRAVELASGSVANAYFGRRAAAVQSDLAAGVKLPEALRRLDPAGELTWRLRNATQSRDGFLAALAGWHEALEGRAFAQEQIFAQSLTSALVVVNGVFVALLAIGVFQMFTRLTHAALMS